MVLLRSMLFLLLAAVIIKIGILSPVGACGTTEKYLWPVCLQLSAAIPWGRDLATCRSPKTPSRTDPDSCMEHDEKHGLSQDVPRRVLDAPKPFQNAPKPSQDASWTPPGYS